MLILFAIIVSFGVRAMENSELPQLKTKEIETQAHEFFRVIFSELVERTADLEKEKYSKILYDFLNPSSIYWRVKVALNRITVATFECEWIGPVKSCRLKTVNGETFYGDVHLHFYEYDTKPTKIYIRSLYVAEYLPRISGKLIVDLVKKMTDSQPNVIASLDDVSNVKILALMTTGKSYYEHLGFHYHSEIERKNFQKVEIDTILLFSCLSKRMEVPMQVGRYSFVFDVHLKRGLLDALRTEIGHGIRLMEDFWRIYRSVIKSVDFHDLLKSFDFDEHLQRCAKTYFFTKYLRKCLQEQMDEDTFEFSKLDRMSYP